MSEQETNRLIAVTQRHRADDKMQILVICMLRQYTKEGFGGQYTEAEFGGQYAEAVFGGQYAEAEFGGQYTETRVQ